MKAIELFLLLFLSVILISSCTEGTVGIDGKDGADGKDGIVNTSTTLFTITPTQWVQHSNWWGVNLIVPSIKDSINDVVIMSAAKVTTIYANQWFGLPLSGIIISGDQLDYVYGKGQATIGYNYHSAPANDIIIKIQVISHVN